jgi:hypothetical protein
LLAQDGLDEVNFWTPSAHRAFRGEVGSPFFFKLKARYGHAVCGFAHFARFTRLVLDAQRTNRERLQQRRTRRLG